MLSGVTIMFLLQFNNPDMTEMRLWIENWGQILLALMFIFIGAFIFAFSGRLK